MKRVLSIIICFLFAVLTMAQNEYKDNINAAQNGDDEAQFIIGLCYYNGIGVKKDFFQSVNWWKKAAEQGNAGAQCNLGLCYDNGNGVKQDKLQAIFWYRKAAEQGMPEAQENLGYCYEEGSGVEQDYYEAFNWFNKAAEQGLATSQERVGSYYLIGQGTNQDLTQAIKWFQKAADKDNILAIYKLGYCYDNGIGVTKDSSQAIYLYNKAADQDNTDALFELGLKYNNGNGVIQDYNKAFNYYLRAATQGNASAQNNLALMYLIGQGVKQDASKALEWFEKAANQGHAGALGNLSRMYYYGDITNKDYNKSEMWIKKEIAIVPDDPYPYSLLALLYAKRDKNYTEALRYSDKAISLAQENNPEILADIYSERGQIFMWQDDIEKAEEVFKKCKELNPKYLEGNDEFLRMMNQYHNNNDVDCNIPTTNKKTKNTFVIIIGNEKYKNEVEVPYADNDAKVFSKYVERTLGVPNEQIKFIENASYNDIRIATNWIIQAMIVCRGKGKAIVYYAGHGIPNESDNSAYLLPVDGIGNDPGSAYALNELYEKLGSVEAQSVTIFLDACFSGSKREEGMLTSARGVAIKTKSATPKGNIIVFSAAQGDETAYPYKDKQHGMFTYYLLKKLQDSKGEVTLGELGDYLIDEVGRKSFVKNGKIQTPTVNVAPALQNTWKNLKLK